MGMFSNNFMHYEYPNIIDVRKPRVEHMNILENNKPSVYDENLYPDRFQIAKESGFIIDAEFTVLIQDDPTALESFFYVQGADNKRLFPEWRYYTTAPICNNCKWWGKVYFPIHEIPKNFRLDYRFTRADDQYMYVMGWIRYLKRGEYRP